MQVSQETASRLERRFALVSRGMPPFEVAEKPGGFLESVDRGIGEGEADLIIGRSKLADVTISDRFLSRRHARMFRDGGEWLIEDLGSRNGTYVNGSRIKEATTVAPGDVITMSESRISVYRKGEHPPEPVDPLAMESVLRPATELLSMSTVMPSRNSCVSFISNCPNRFQLSG